MPVIGMVGPHAIGKTTAARRWAARYTKLVVAIADQQWEESASGKERVKAWKGTAEEKEALVADRRARPVVTLVESVWTTACRFFTPEEPIIIVTCDWRVMERVFRERVKRLGKTFKEDYWTPRKMGYESAVRYLNFAQKNWSPQQYRHFNIEDQARDWPAVDAHFGALYRRLNNQTLRGGSDGCHEQNDSAGLEQGRVPQGHLGH